MLVCSGFEVFGGTLSSHTPSAGRDRAPSGLQHGIDDSARDGGMVGIDVFAHVCYVRMLN